jgi:hypothetical protein
MTGNDHIFICPSIPMQMKRTATILTTLIVGIFTSVLISAQCEPDTANCKDIGDPGQFCPLELPEAGLNVLYDEVVTIIPPGSYNIWGNELTIHYIEIDSVKNLPPGIDYFPNAVIFHPDTAYCIQLTGIPSEAGVFALSIHIGATVDLFGTPTRALVVDSTSVVITVVENLGIEPNQITEFQVFQNVPNPFSFRTSLAYYTPKQERIELSIYNILGILVHQESELAAPGKHNFNFDGSELQPGTYLYRVEISEDYFTGKFMKSR